MRIMDDGAYRDIHRDERASEGSKDDLNRITRTHPYIVYMGRARS